MSLLGQNRVLFREVFPHCIDSLMNLIRSESVISTDVASLLDICLKDGLNYNDIMLIPTAKCRNTLIQREILTWEDMVRLITKDLKCKTSVLSVIFHLMCSNCTVESLNMI
jgi:hypothetical protein